MILDNFKLDGKVALVTGAGQGLGQAMALALAEAGADVAGLDRVPSEATGEAVRALGRRYHPVVCDLREAGVAALNGIVQGVGAKLGRLDILVNNAGIIRDALVPEMGDEDWHSVLDTNLSGVFLCSRLAARHMLRKRWGRIINVSSVAGSFSHPPMTAYCASKWALEAMSESLACEMKTFGVRVALVKPGIIDTSMAHRIGAAFGDPGSPGPRDRSPDANDRLPACG